MLANNNSQIPQRTLTAIMEVIESRSEDIVSRWNDIFGETRFYI